MTRMEFTFFDWLSAVGGLGSIVFAVSNAAGALDNAQMFVTSALLPPEDKPEEKRAYSATFSPSEVQDKCCVTMRSKLAVHRKMPKCCKCGGTKGRILGAVHEDMKNCMYIHNLFKHLRTTEGIIRERLNVSDQDWRLATQKYAYLKNPARDINKVHNLDDSDQNKPLEASQLGAGNYKLIQTSF